MTEQPQDPTDPRQEAATDGTGAARPQPEWEETAARVGGALGRFARRARAASEQAIQDARPEAERLARQARAAAEAARPHVERAGRTVATEATRFAREHQDEIKRAARVGAELTARRVVPLPLRPLVDALEAEHLHRPAPLTDDRADALADNHPDGRTPPTA